MKLRSKVKHSSGDSTTTLGGSPCFFCLQDSRELDSDIPNKTEPFSLRHISRFLKIFENDEDEEREKLSEDLKRKLFTLANDNDESSVFICQNCSKMMKEFKELYHLMEVTKLRLNWCLKRMQDVMAMPKSKERNDDDVNLLQTLRNKMIDRMNAITSQPRIVLRPSKLPRTKTLFRHAETPTKSISVTTRSKSNPKASIKSPSNLKPANENSTKLSVSEPEPKNSKLNDGEECTSVAPAISTEKVPETSEQESEVTGSNSNSKFSPPDSSNTSNEVQSSNSPNTDEEFDTGPTCKSNSASTLQPPPPHENVTSCSNGTPKSPPKIQLVFIHHHKTGSTEEENDTIAVAQATVTSTSACQPPVEHEVLASSCASSDKIPEDSMTPVPVSSGNEASREDDDGHETVQGSQRSVPEVPKKYLKCSLCRAQFHITSSDPYGPQLLLRRHTLTNHCEKLFPIQEHKLGHVTVPEYKKILNQLLFSDFINGMETCPYCEVKYMNSLTGIKKADRIARIKSHLVEFHLTRIKDLLQDIQENPNLQKMLEDCNPEGKLCKCGVYVANSKIQEIHEKLHCALTETPKLELESRPPQINKVDSPEKPKSVCPFCRFEYFGNSNATKFTMHLVTFHAEHYFNHIMEQFPTLTKDQFQRLIHHSLFPELLPDSNTCQLLCQTRFRTQIGLKHHLIRYHRNELKDRLRMILQASNLQEKLKSFQRQGMSCYCGMYLPQKSSQDYHDKFQCKLKTTHDDVRLPTSSSGSHNTPVKVNDNDLQLKINGSYSLFSINDGVTEQNAAVWKPPNEDDVQVTCSYCRAQFKRCKPKNVEDVDYLERHMLQYHGHHYFPQHKIDSISDSQFQKILVELLFKDLVDVEDGKTSASCSYCDKTFAISVDNVKRKACIFQIKFHLIREHYGKLEEKLSEIQKTHKLSEILEGCNPDGKMCQTGCGVYLPDVISQVMHDRMHCTRTPTSATILRNDLNGLEKSKFHHLNVNGRSESPPSHSESIAFPKYPDPGESKKMKLNRDNKFSCLYCRAQFQNDEHQLNRHLLKYHGQHFFPKHKFDSISDSDFQKILVELLFKDIIDVKTTSCHFCNKPFIISSEKGKKQVCLFKNKMHIINGHFKELEEKLRNIQKDPSLKNTLALCNTQGRMCKTGCGVYLSDVFSQVVHSKFHCNGNGKDSGESSPAASPSCIATTTPGKVHQQRLTKKLKSFKSSKKDDVDGQSISKFLKCSQCRAQFNSSNKSSVTRPFFRQHTVTYHCEQHFPVENHKLDHVTVPEYKKILSQLLFKDFISEPGEGSQSQCCSFCKKKFTISSNKKAEFISAIKLHLVESHILQMKEKLKQIQEDANLLMKLEECNPKGKLCRCGVYLPNVLSQSRHDKFHCILSRNKDMKEPEPVKHVDLQYNFTPCEDITRTCCQLCQRVITNGRQHMLFHWKHCCPKGLRVRRRQIHAKMDADGNKITKSCSYCRFKFSGDCRPVAVTMHLVSFHPEHFFLDVKECEENGLTKDQFQRIIQNILFPEFVPKNKPFKCQLLCRTQFKSKQDLKNHLVRYHVKEMKDRLKMILRDEHLQENLKRLQGQGKSCPCGMYIPSWDTVSSQDYHDKFHCKLKAGSDDNHLTSTSSQIQEGDYNEGEIIINRSYSLSNVEVSKEKDTTKVDCPYCSAQFTKSCSKYEAQHLNRHLLKYHGQHFFPKHKLGSISDFDFHKILAELLFKDIVDVETTSCHFCNKPFAISSRKGEKQLRLFRNKMHILKEHYKELEEKLLEIQRDPNVGKTLALCNPLGSMCKTGCGVYLPDKFSQLTHGRMHCSGGPREPNEIQSDSNTSRREDEEITDENERGEKRPLRKMKFSNENGDSPTFTKTKNPRKKFIVKINEDEPISSLRKEEKEPPSIPKGSSLDESTSTLPTSCPYCRYQCNDNRKLGYSMSNHLLLFHPQYYFPQVDDRCQVTEDQFQRAIHDILFRQVALGEGKYLSCNICEEKFSGKDNYTSNCKLRRHLVASHRNELTERLKDILNDPDLRGKLASANSVGASCPCGMYLPNGFNPKDNQHHEKFQCSLKPEEERMQVEVEGHAGEGEPEIDVKYDVTFGDVDSLSPLSHGEVDIEEIGEPEEVDEDEYKFNEHIQLPFNHDEIEELMEDGDSLEVEF